MAYQGNVLTASPIATGDSTVASTNISKESYTHEERPAHMKRDVRL